MLALALVPSLFVAPVAPLSMALAKPNILFRLSLIEFCLKMPIILLGVYYYGLAGLLAVRLTISVLMAGFSMLTVRELIGLPLRVQVFGPWRSILSCIFMSLTVVSFGDWLSGREDYGSLVGGLSTVVGASALVYMISMLLLWRATGCPDGLESRVVGAVHQFLQSTLKPSQEV
nr:polysaccharide biosynthesis C-terminal domain-containing protein [Bradyrhizobium sp. BRP22]